MTLPRESNSDTQLKASLARLDRIRTDVAKAVETAQAEFKFMRALVIGLRVRRFGRLWQICEARIGLSAEIVVYGVALRKAGDRVIVGTRGFALGSLDGCEIIE